MGIDHAPPDGCLVSGYPPFSGDDPTCPKCGNAGARTEYRPYGTCAHNAGAVRGYEANERLHRECSRCDYAWDEATVAQESFTDQHFDPGLTEG